jgi:hypothetical protein
VGLDVSAKTIGSALTSNCIIVNVTSRRLEGMLERRGYKKREVPDGEGGTQSTNGDGVARKTPRPEKVAVLRPHTVTLSHTN